MKKLKVFSIVLTVVSAIFLGYSLYLHRSYAKVNDKAIAICNMFTKLNPTYTKYFFFPTPVLTLVHSSSPGLNSSSGDYKRHSSFLPIP